MALLIERLERIGPIDKAAVFAVDAPLRICPLGAHVDHQGGVVTGLTIDRSVTVAAAPTEEPVLEISSLDFPGTATIGWREAHDGPMSDWADYARGSDGIFEVEEQLAGQHVANDDVGVVINGTPGTDQESSAPAIRSDVGGRQVFPPQGRQRGWNPTRIGHGLLEVAAGVHSHEIDAEEALQSNEVGPCPVAPELVSCRLGLTLEIFLDQFPEFDRDFCTTAENGLDWSRKPTVNRSLEKVRCDQEDQNHRYEGQTDIGQNELRAKSTPEDAGLALDRETEQVSEQNEAEDDDE